MVWATINPAMALLSSTSIQAVWAFNSSTSDLQARQLACTVAMDTGVI